MAIVVQNKKATNEVSKLITNKADPELQVVNISNACGLISIEQIQTTPVTQWVQAKGTYAVPTYLTI